MLGITGVEAVRCGWLVTGGGCGGPGTAPLTPFGWFRLMDAVSMDCERGIASVLIDMAG
jgi:hypothetical protein